MKEKKIPGEKRREVILHLLKTSEKPLTGSELAEKTNVSRQVIVSDISLLKARNEPIIATSQGYSFLKEASLEPRFERTIACRHTPEKTEEELNLLVDHGVTVRDVRIEHSVYGDLTAAIMVSNRREVKQFIKQIHATKSSFLSELTDGIHLHTISAPNEQALDEAIDSLKNAGFLIESN